MSDLAFLYVAEIKYWDGAAEQTLYVASAPFATAAGDTPAHTIMEPRLAQPVVVQRDAFDQLKTSGRSRVGYGNLELLNDDDGALDPLVAGGVDGRSLIVRRGVPGAAYPAGFTTVFKGTMQTVVSDDGSTVTIKVRDQQQLLSVPFQTTKYAGTNALPNGLEGTAADIGGKPKPVCLGQVFNVALPCVNTSKLIYQAHAGALASVDAVYDRAIPLINGGTYATLADLQNDALAPNPGEFKAYLAGGYIRLGGPAPTLITADVTEGATAADRTAGQLAVRAMQRAGFTAGAWSAADITALDAAMNAVCGVWIDGETTTDVVLDAIAGSPWAWWGPDVTGVIRIKRVAAPVAPSVVDFVRDDLIGPLQQLVSNDPADGLPSYQTILKYARNYTVQVVDFNVTYAPTAPSSPQLDDLWIDTSVTPNVWNRWNGTAWVAATPTTAAQILYGSGATVESLKPAEAGAEVTTGKSLTLLTNRTTANIAESTDKNYSTQVCGTGDGFQILNLPDFLGGLNPFGVYDNAAGGHVTHTIEADNTAPNSSGYRCKITVSAGAVYNVNVSPDWGGFYRGIGPDSGAFALNTYHRGSTILWRIRAKIPVGFHIDWASNATGTGATAVWLTDNAGTGDWADYVLKQVIGTTGTFSTTGFFYLSQSSGATLPFSWYVAVCSAVCITHPSGLAVREVDGGQLAIIDLSQAHYNRTADYIAESILRKWAAESGADVTSGKSLTVLVDRTADHVSYTLGGTVDSLKPAEAGAEVTTGKSVDILADGATYARTKGTELTAGQVKQIRDAVESLTRTTNELRRETIMWGLVL